MGILSLETRFPRVLGDGGNPASYRVPATVRRVPGASIEAAVFADPMRLLERFAREARALEADGCTAITTTCGFLAPLEAGLQAAVRVPVFTSALALARPGTGVLTIAASALTPAHYEAAGMAFDTPVATMEGTTFADAILDDRETLDTDRARAEHAEVARRFAARHDLTAIVLECTNMPPYAEAIEAATGLPVLSILTLARRIMGPPNET